MKISKIRVPISTTQSKNLEEINLTVKPLGNTVALVGKNGAGKSRVLSFVENYHQTITPEDFINDYFENLPPFILEKFKRNLESAKSQIKQSENIKVSESSKINIKTQAFQTANVLFQHFRKYAKAYIKVVDNDDLKNINKMVNNSSSISFEQILKNKHFVTNNLTNQNQIDVNFNEFSQFNSDSTINYFTDLTNQIATEEFNIYINNRSNPELVDTKIRENESFQLFEIFKGYVKKFLGKDFSYKQTAKGNTVHSTLNFNKQPFNIDQFSPGQKTLFAYAILFFYLDVNSKANIKDSIIIIDEPEKHLHPEAQISLIKALKTIISKTGQLWIATHSINILSHLNYDEIIMVSDNKIIPPSRTTPGKSFNELMGLEDHVLKLIEFINSISDWAYGNFMLQCFKDPEVVFGKNPNDPQFQLFKEFLADKSKINLLDFGAGKGRIGYTLNEDTEISEKANYFAYEPDKANFDFLNKVPLLKKIYSNSKEIPDNSFDCVLLCNVLHEIHPNDWIDVFSTIKRILTADGYLLIIEDKYLPRGENAHSYGYLILGTEETKILLGAEKILELKLQEEKYKERIIFNAFKKDQINVQSKNIEKSILKLQENAFSRIKLIRKKDRDISQGRLYANETQLYINASLALEGMTN